MAKKAPDAPADALARTREDALRIAHGKGREGVHRALRGAAVDLERRIRGGDSSEGFNQRRMRQTLMQVREATRRLNDGIRDVVVEGVEGAAGSATENLLRYMRDSERLYRGISQPLPLRETELYDKAVSGARASVLRRLSTGERGDAVDPAAPDYNEAAAPAEGAPARMGILQRYGVETVGQFENILMRGFVAKTSWGEMRDAITEASPFLEGQPAYWAERIVRTEVMGGYNRAGWEATRAADDELGDMVKILCATFDDRTGWDSYQVHGQIRLPDQAFEWAEGAYQHPPNRPNDREVVVPHRIAWPIPPNLMPVGDDAVAAVYARQRKTGGPGPRPLMTTVDLGRFGQG